MSPSVTPHELTAAVTRVRHGGTLADLVTDPHRAVAVAEALARRIVELTPTVDDAGLADEVLRVLAALEAAHDKRMADLVTLGGKGDTVIPVAARVLAEMPDARAAIAAVRSHVLRRIVNS